jgi:hypothetical protein
VPARVGGVPAGSGVLPVRSREMLVISEWDEERGSTSYKSR